MKNKYLEVLENYFNIYEDTKSYDLEAWTDYGVNMFIYIKKDKDLIKQLKDYVENFDVDKEIDLHRQGEDYKNNFTIRQSLEDFENWLDFVNNVIRKLERL